MSLRIAANNDHPIHQKFTFTSTLTLFHNDQNAFLTFLTCRLVVVAAVGRFVGFRVGGAFVGLGVVGLNVGLDVGDLVVGLDVGELVGLEVVGLDVGELVGADVGAGVKVVGEDDGEGDGAEVSKPKLFADCRTYNPCSIPLTMTVPE